uniref:Glycosyltransferase family 92 protein n=1 Tax=Ascaris suum TaxID=6253 RepID=F1LC75_ASCSU
MDFEHDLSYDPNEEMEWRGQVVAQTDCLLKYKVSAKFVIFGDLDDILFPRLGKSYLSEFETLLVQNKFAAAFIYNRYESYLTSARQPATYSILSALQSAKISTRWVDGKWVAVSSRVMTTAIHYPWIVNNGYSIVTVPNHTNIMAHFRSWKFVEDMRSARSRRNTRSDVDWLEKNETIMLSTLIDVEDMNAIENNFMETMEANAQVFNELPNSEVYYKLIEKCYNRIFYSVDKTPSICPTHFHCMLPELPGVHCTRFNGRYEEKVLARKFRVHYSYNWYTEESSRGCGT